MTDKEKATIKILKLLKSNMAVINKFNREQCLTLAVEHGITVEDLINMANEMALNI